MLQSMNRRLLNGMFMKKFISGSFANSASHTSLVYPSRRGFFKNRSPRPKTDDSFNQQETPKFLKSHNKKYNADNVPDFLNKIDFNALKGQTEKRLIKMSSVSESIKQINERYFQGDYHTLVTTLQYTNFNPWIFGAACHLFASHGQRGSRRGSHWIRYRDASSIDFIPYTADSGLLDKCVKSVQKHRELFKTGKHQITDWEFDFLKQKTKILLQKTDNAIDSSSLSEGTLNECKALINTKSRIKETYNTEDIEQYYLQLREKLGARLDVTKFIFIPVINGVSFQVTYNSGLMHKAIATEFGAKDVDITDLVKAMRSIPKVISTQGVATFNGRLFLHTKDFHLLNYERNNSGLLPWIDSRAAIAHAILHAEEPYKALEHRLRCYFDNCNIESQKDLSAFTKVSDIFRYLTANGFPNMSSSYGLTEKWKNTLPIIQSLKKLPFQCSGVSIQLNDTTEASMVQQMSCVYKLTPSFSTTQINRINFKILPSGTITAVVYVEPIKIEDKNVSRFLVTNETFLRNQDFRVGDTVIISASPNMQPQLLISYRDSLSKPSSFPSSCPRCKSTIRSKTIDSSAVIKYCSTHTVCKDDNLKKIAHFTGKHGLHIPSLSVSIIEELIKKFLVTSSSDLFLLSESHYDLLQGISIEEFRDLLSEIRYAKNTTLERFIYALNIPSVTYLMTEELAYLVGTVERLSQISLKELLKLEYLDKKAAKEILAFFADSKNHEEIQALLTAGIMVAQPNQEIISLCYKDLEAYTLYDYKQIIKKIHECNKSYSITDFEFDLLNTTAEKIEKKHPNWTVSRTPQSHTKALVKFEDPMRRAEKTYFAEKVKLFCQKIVQHGIIVEPKVDGVACFLYYQNGIFVKALTKHDGKSGYDISSYAKMIPAIPKKLKQNYTGAIRGELFITNRDFSELNVQRQRSGLSLYVSPLSVVVGSINSTKKNDAVNNNIQFFGYHLSNITKARKINRSPSNIIVTSQIELHKYLKVLGFSCEIDTAFSTFQDATAAFQYATDPNMQHRFPMCIDGMVIKPLQLFSPSSDKSISPKSCYYKFKLPNMMTKLQNVKCNVSSTGKLFFVATVDPITFPNGRKVSRVNLYNLQNMCKGDVVSVSYRGGSLPVLESVFPDKRQANAEPIIIPTHCPECDTKLLQKEKGMLQCQNSRCNGNSEDFALFNFVKVMKICNHTTMRKLIETKYIMTLSDLYNVVYEELYASNTLTPNEVRSLVAGIEKSKNAPIKQILRAMNINGVSGADIQKIADEIPSLAKLRKMKSIDLEAIGIARIIAQRISMYFADNSHEIDSLIQAGVDGATEKRGMTRLDIKKTYDDFILRESHSSSLVKVALDAVLKNLQKNNTNAVILHAYADDALARGVLRTIEASIRRDKKFIVNSQRHIEMHKHPALPALLNSSSAQGKYLKKDVKFFGKSDVDNFNEDDANDAIFLNQEDEDMYLDPTSERFST
jgi:DNA ligase (NAD+)